MTDAAAVRTRRWVSPGLVLLGAGLVVATASENGPTLRPFALMTGVACLCGLTLAAAHLV